YHSAQSSRLPHCKDAHGLAHTLKRLLTSVLNRYARGSPRQRAHGVRDQHLARRREAADSRGNVDGAAEDVVFLADHIAGVEAEVQREAGVIARAGAGECRLDRLRGAGKRGEDAVSEELAFDWCAGVVASDAAKGV